MEYKILDGELTEVRISETDTEIMIPGGVVSIGSGVFSGWSSGCGDNSFRHTLTMVFSVIELRESDPLKTALPGSRKSAQGATVPCSELSDASFAERTDIRCFAEGSSTPR